MINAEHEIDLLLKNEKKEYIKNCAKSALKAYKSLEEDNHSGLSIKVTQELLNRLLDNFPLSPIYDQDFVEIKELSTEEATRYRCTRYPSLYKTVTKDGKVSYTDHKRTRVVNQYGNTFQQPYADELVDKYFPIKMPYYPSHKTYKVFCEKLYLDEYKNKIAKVPQDGVNYIKYLYIITPYKQKFVLDEEVDLTKEEFMNDKKYILKNNY